MAHFIKETAVKAEFNPEGFRVPAAAIQYLDNVVGHFIRAAMEQCRKRGAKLISLEDFPLVESAHRALDTGLVIRRPKATERIIRRQRGV